MVNSVLLQLQKLSNHPFLQPSLCGRLTEEEDSIPSGPPRTKNEILFDDSLIYDPDSAVIQNGKHEGMEACDNPILSANTGSAAFSAEELTLIGNIM